MSADTVITVVGNLTGDPELRFTPSGAAVASFTIASTPRSFDRASNEWKDGETLFLRCPRPRKRMTCPQDCWSESLVSR
jgi:single-strand DNA-binding protein